MNTTVTVHTDGRIVIPKQLREELQLIPGTAISLKIIEGRLHLERAGCEDKSA